MSDKGQKQSLLYLDANRCPRCGKQFTTHEQLVTHWRRHHYPSDFTVSHPKSTRGGGAIAHAKTAAPRHDIPPTRPPRQKRVRSTQADSPPPPFQNNKSLSSSRRSTDRKQARPSSASTRHPPAETSSSGGGGGGIPPVHPPFVFPPRPPARKTPARPSSASTRHPAETPSSGGGGIEPLPLSSVYPQWYLLPRHRTGRAGPSSGFTYHPPAETSSSGGGSGFERPPPRNRQARPFSVSTTYHPPPAHTTSSTSEGRSDLVPLPLDVVFSSSTIDLSDAYRPGHTSSTPRPPSRFVFPPPFSHGRIGQRRPSSAPTLYRPTSGHGGGGALLSTTPVSSRPTGNEDKKKVNEEKVKCDICHRWMYETTLPSHYEMYHPKKKGGGDSTK